MRRILALCVPLFPAPLLAAPVLHQGQPQSNAPVITVAGHAFLSWSEYTGSSEFHSLGLRCGTRANGSVSELFSLSDCSLGSTTIRPQYESAGHALYQIPVVVHVIQSTSGDGQISDAMIASQLDVLNEDFLALAGTLGENGNDARIEFYLATSDPSGNPTTGITRSTNDTWFNDGGNYYDVLKWDPARYLNIYTNLCSGALGYVPDLPQGGIVGANFDRVVILWSAFGRNAPIGAPYDLGRTVTHEVGHFFGLYHPFDGGCGSAVACYTSGDCICDTNPEAQPVFGCPLSHSSCGTSDPFHDYMDYSDDPCYQEFTLEQVNRMRCTLVNWRMQLDQPQSCAALAGASTRTSGANLAVYSATPPVLGGNSTLSIVDASHTSAVVIGYASPRSLPLPSGMVLLVDTGSARYFRQAISLPSAGVTLSVPNDAGLCGLTAFSQAVLLGGSGFALSNAVDLSAGL